MRRRPSASIVSVAAAIRPGAGSGGMGSPRADRAAQGRMRLRLAAKRTAAHAAPAPTCRAFRAGQPALAESARIGLLVHVQQQASGECDKVVNGNIDVDVGHFGLLWRAATEDLSRNRKATIELVLRLLS
jgi:hypothetical protein